MEVDWKGVARTYKRLGAEGTNVLMAKGRGLDVAVLDRVIEEDPFGPANGPWYPVPRGFALLVEGTDEELTQWTTALAARLTGLGVEGTLTGAPVAQLQDWVHTVVGGPGWSANLAYEPTVRPGAYGGWGGTEETLAAVLDYGVGWAATPGAPLLVFLSSFYMRFSPEGARRVAASQWHHPIAGNAHMLVEDTTRHETRTLDAMKRGLLSLTTRNPAAHSMDQVRDLIATLRHAPLDTLSLAMVSHLTWIDLLYGHSPGATYFSMWAPNHHPELLSEYTLDPCGFQILTPHHLEKATDLTAWTTTRLDATHYTLEARDQAAWYATPRPWNQPVDPDLLDQARHDFGAMILTNDLATTHGWDIKPPTP